MLFCIAIILTNILIMNDLVIVPIINDLYGAFPDSPMGVGTIISAPSIITIIAALLVPGLMKKFSSRTLMIASCAAFCLVSIFGCAVENVWYMVGCRVICGFCYAVVNVVYVALVAEVYVDSRRRARFMGVFNGMMSLIGAIMSLAAGTLATEGWQHAYRVYWAAIPMLIMVILFIPKPEDIDHSVAAQEAEQGAAAAPMVETGISGRFWVMMGVFFLFNLCYAYFSNFQSVYVAENALGDQSFAGMVTSIATIVSAVTCFFFDKSYGFLKGRMCTAACLLMVIGIALAYFLPGTATVLITAALLGTAYGNCLTFAYTHCVLLVGGDKVESAIGIITAVSCGGMTVSSYLVPWMMELFGGCFTPTLAVILLLLIAITVVEFLSSGSARRKGANY